MSPNMSHAALLLDLLSLPHEIFVTVGTTMAKPKRARFSNDTDPADEPITTHDTPSPSPDTHADECTPSTQPVDTTNPSTPPSTAQTFLQTTPANKGAGSQHDHVINFIASDVEPYIIEDLARNKVYLHFDQFLELIFNVPADWTNNAAFKQAVDVVDRDPDFKQWMKTYRRLVRDATEEEQLYGGFIDICNSGTQATTPTTTPNTLFPAGDIFSYRQDHSYLTGAKRNILPDVNTVLYSLFESSGNQKRHDKGPKHSFGWPQILDFREMKLESALLDCGVGAHVVQHDGPVPDPRKTAQVAFSALKVQKRTGVFHTASGIKRPRSNSRDEMPLRPSKTPKRDPKLVTVADAPSVLPPIPTPKLHVTDASEARLKASLQCASNGLAMLSAAGFRSHAIGFLVGKDSIQGLYYDRSSIVVSSPFSIVTDRRTFVAMLVALQRLSLRQRGVMDVLMEDKFVTQYKNYTAAMKNDPSLLFVGKQITLGGIDGKPEYTVTLGRILYRQPGLIGRGTCVVEATSTRWGFALVVKISWPSEERTKEISFIEIIRTAVKKKGAEADWVKGHIPNILDSQDFAIAHDAPAHKLRDFLNAASTLYVPGTGSFHYESRVCRVSVHERLFPLEQLARPRDHAQVLFDVLQVHRWIFDHPRVMHRDLSFGNIMWHEYQGRICGVLNDFDLSSRRDWPGQTSKQRTGTRPFMAFELQSPSPEPVLPLYRHELESFYFICLILFCAHNYFTIPTPGLIREPASPFYQWLELDEAHSYAVKSNHLTQNESLRVVPSPFFKLIKPALKQMYKALHEGYRARTAALDVDDADDDAEGDAEDTDFDTLFTDIPLAPAAAVPAALPSTFDNETLDGHVTYEAFFDGLASEKFGLIKSYKPADCLPL